MQTPVVPTRLVAVAAAMVAAALGASGCGGGPDRSGDARAEPVKASGLDSSRSGRPATVWAVGDGADGEAAGRRVGRLVARGEPDRFLYLGDVYEEGTAQDYKDKYEPAFGPLARVTAPTPGNHEWPRHAEGYGPYWRAVTGKEIPDYYRFSIGGWEVFSLNDQVPHGAGSPQLRWLRTNAAGPGTCRLAFWHRPRYSFGDHGDQPDVEPFWDALRGHATLIVNGHEHNMERFGPRDGITELVAGAGGRGIYRIKPENRAQLAFGNDTDFGALRLRLRPGRADYRFVAVDGRTLDSGRVRCATGSDKDSRPVSAF